MSDYTLGQLDPAPQGCICPPTSEKTCQNPTCPRKPMTVKVWGLNSIERGGSGMNDDLVKWLGRRWPNEDPKTYAEKKEAMQRIEELEAKLAKAVGMLAAITDDNDYRCPLPPFVAQAEDARGWAERASAAELKFYAWACVERLSPADRRALYVALASRVA